MTETTKHTPDLTSSELIFVRRMLPHFMAGKSVDEAAAAVIEDDRRLAGRVLDYSYSETEKNTRAGIRSELCAQVYRDIRAIAKAEGR